MKTTLLDHTEVEAAGYEQFNIGPHLCVDLPNEMCCISCKLPDGRKVTFAYLPSASCIDIKDHGGPEIQFNGEKAHVHNALLLGAGRHVFDSRKLPIENRPLITVLLLEN